MALVYVLILPTFLVTLYMIRPAFPLRLNIQLAPRLVN